MHIPRERIHDFEPLSDRLQDDILTVSAQLEQMLQLLQLEQASCRVPSGPSRPSSILDMILSDSDNILAQIVSWSKALPYTSSDPLILLQLQLFETLLSCTSGGQNVLSHVKVTLASTLTSCLNYHLLPLPSRPLDLLSPCLTTVPQVLHPLVHLLELVNNLPSGHSPSTSLQVGARDAIPDVSSPLPQATLLSLVHTLCLLLMESSPLLDLFTSDDNPRFILFSLLTPYLHR